MGPLRGLKIIEMVGIGPGPFVGMLLADLGADVIAVDRRGRGKVLPVKTDIADRGKRSVVLDLKTVEGRQALLDLCATADGIFEGFRPGVMEKLGAGPELCLEVNPSLVYGRMTGWGQTGPLSHAAGHDLNYIALTGALHAMGDADRPPSPPLNLVGDYGGGLFLALGMVSAILHAKTSGKGQVVDAAMVDGVNVLMTLFHSLMDSKLWRRERHGNILDGAAPFYRCYETRDGKYISIAPIEYPFMEELVAKSGAPESVLEGHKNPHAWPAISQALEVHFKTRTQDEWCRLLEGSDACFAPVVPFWEASEHPHNQARKAFLMLDGVRQPAPAPRFSETSPEITHNAVETGAHSREILQSLGYDDARIERLLT